MLLKGSQQGFLMDIARKKEERSEGYPKVFHLNGQMNGIARLPACSSGSMPGAGAEWSGENTGSCPVLVRRRSTPVF